MSQASTAIIFMRRRDTQNIEEMSALEYTLKHQRETHLSFLNVTLQPLHVTWHVRSSRVLF